MPIINELLVDMYGCEGGLDDERFLCDTLEKAARHADAKIIRRIIQRFSPHGISVILILAETHISIHTWPEYEYAALDIFICGEGKDPEAAWAVIKEALRPRDFRIKRIKRKVDKTLN
ncbi:adenosylmethionine decarboxylase [Candidatus Bathyarchaeota archaeon]|nr:MAG: adenosylmethionine decarboxylase [Candidatus Bathyarchaeota archaeon]